MGEGGGLETDCQETKLNEKKNVCVQISVSIQRDLLILDAVVIFKVIYGKAGPRLFIELPGLRHESMSGRETDVLASRALGTARRSCTEQSM